MRIEIGVTPYVYQFILYEYGPGPYQVSKGHDLMIGFSSSSLNAEMLESRAPIGRRIFIDISKSPNASSIIREQQKYLNAGLYYQHEFFRAMRTWVNGLTTQGIPATEALARFLAHYEITEDMYSMDSAYRQLTRKKSNIYDDVVNFLGQKIEFLGQATPATSQVRKEQTANRTRLLFCTFNPDTNRRERFRITIPSRIRGNYKQQFVQACSEYINHQLAMGYSCRRIVREAAPAMHELALE